jgi:hypothetical protein
VTYPSAQSSNFQIPLISPSNSHHDGAALEHPIIRATHFGYETGSPLVFTVMLPWPTPRRAATIEPKVQEPISNVRALKNVQPNKSTMFSSICTFSFVSLDVGESQILFEPLRVRSFRTLCLRGDLAPAFTVEMGRSQGHSLLLISVANSWQEASTLCGQENWTILLPAERSCRP